MREWVFGEISKDVGLNTPQQGSASNTRCQVQEAPHRGLILHEFVFVNYLEDGNPYGAGDQGTGRGGWASGRLMGAGLSLG